MSLLYISFLSAFLFYNRNWFILLKDFILCACFFFLGAYLIQPVPLSIQSGAIYQFSGRCEERLPYNNYILSSEGQKFYLSRFYTDTLYRQGDSLTFYCKIRKLRNNINPGEFSYANYLKQKSVIYHLFPVSKIIVSGHSGNIRTFFNTQREKLLKKTACLLPDPRLRNLTDALCLGYKNDLDSETQELFVRTGTIHLLSVSGLHTGAIYLLLVYILKRFKPKNRKSELLLLPLLWGYACLTGLSPSVVRASTILSFITFGNVFKRDYTPLNSLAASAFFTLLLQPNLIYSLSFLLSYSAYTGILVLYPILHKLPGHLPWYLDKPYACCCLTVSAQLLTLPLSAYFFHTININGFLINLIAIPLATILLYSATICLILPVIISQFLIPLPKLSSRLLLGYLEMAQPYTYNIENLYPSSWLILCLYICLICLGIYLCLRKAIWLQNTLITCLILLPVVSFLSYRNSSGKEVVVFQIYRTSTILLNYHGYYSFLKNTSPDITRVQPYIRQNQLQSLPQHSGLLTTGLYLYKQKLFTNGNNFCILDRQHAVVPDCNIWIITDNLSPSAILQLPPESLPSTIITDGSNNNFIVREWEQFCKDQNIIFHNTQESGSIHLKIAERADRSIERN